MTYFVFNVYSNYYEHLFVNTNSSKCLYSLSAMTCNNYSHKWIHLCLLFEILSCLSTLSILNLNEHPNILSYILAK